MPRVTNFHGMQLWWWEFATRVGNLVLGNIQLFGVLVKQSCETSRGLGLVNQYYYLGIDWCENFGVISCNSFSFGIIQRQVLSFKNLGLWEAEPEALGASGSGGKLVYLTHIHFGSQNIGATTTTTWVGEIGVFMSNGSLPGDFGRRCGFFFRRFIV